MTSFFGKMIRRGRLVGEHGPDGVVALQCKSSTTPFQPLPLTSTPFQPQANPLSMYPTLFFRSSSSGLILLLISLQSNDKYSNTGRNFCYHPFRFIDNQSKNSPWDVQCHPLTFTETKSRPLSVPFLNCTPGKAQSEPSRLGWTKSRLQTICMLVGFRASLENGWQN